MKILLLSANPLIAPSPVYPLGLDYVAGAVSDRHDVQIVDLNEKQGRERMARIIEDFSPHLIGLSLRNIDNQDAFETKSYLDGYSRLISGIRSMTKAKIVLGGSGFTIFPTELMALLGADYGIVGDGEQLAPLMDALEFQSDLRGIPGVVTRDDSTADAPKNTSTLFQRSFEADRPHVRYYLQQGGILNLQTKRGCPYRCIYCTYPRIDGSRLRLIDPGEVARTARMLQDAGARYLFLTDSTFNCSPDHSLSVAKAFIKARLSIPWGAFFAPFRPPADYYKILAEAGLSHCEFGTESLCDRVLSAYGKPFCTDDVLYASGQALDAGLHIAHYLLFGGPGEDEQTLVETLANAEKLEKTVLILFCGMRIYPHTPLHEIAVRQGQIPRNSNLLEPVFYRSPGLDPVAMTAMLAARAAERPHWILGAGGEETANIVSRLHARGHCGPLWEKLIPQ